MPGLIGLNAFVFWFALPALLFHKVAITPFARLTDWTLYVGYEGACVRSIAWCWWWRWGAAPFPARGGDLRLRSLLGQCRLHGRAAAGRRLRRGGGLPAVLAVVLDTLVLQSLTILLLESGGGAGARRPAHGRPRRRPQSADHRRVRRRDRGGARASACPPRWSAFSACSVRPRLRAHCSRWARRCAAVP